MLMLLFGRRVLALRLLLLARVTTRCRLSTSRLTLPPCPALLLLRRLLRLRLFLSLSRIFIQLIFVRRWRRRLLLYGAWITTACLLACLWRWLLILRLSIHSRLRSLLPFLAKLFQVGNRRNCAGAEPLTLAVGILI